MSSTKGTQHAVCVCVCSCMFICTCVVCMCVSVTIIERTLILNGGHKRAWRKIGNGDNYVNTVSMYESLKNNYLRKVAFVSKEESAFSILLKISL